MGCGDAQTCCGCCSVRDGSLAIGWFGVVTGGFVFGVGVYFIASDPGILDSTYVYHLCRKLVRTIPTTLE